MSRVCMFCFGDLNEPKNGYTIRCWALVKQLTNKGNEVTVYQFSNETKRNVREGVVIQSIAVNHENGRSGFLANLLGIDPFKELLFPFEGYWKLRSYKKEILGFDEFYIDGCLLINAFILLKRLNLPITLDTNCINKDVAIKIMNDHKLKGSIRVVLWHLIEKNIIGRSSRVIAISEHDKAFINKHYGVDLDKIEIIPHMVAPPASKKYTDSAHEIRNQLATGYEKVACFIGDLGAIQNKESENYIKTVLAPQTPNVHYILVGNKTTDHINTANITYTGFVDAIDPYIMMADFCIAPMSIGSGVKTKVLDYLKYNKQVVATPVAVEGIAYDRHLYVCEMKEFVNEVKRLTATNT